MKQRFGVYAALVLAGAIVFAEAVWCQSEGDSANGLPLSVQVHNWAKVSRTTLQKGQALAGEIFREAGVKVEWVECPCEGRPEAMTLVLRIIPKLFGSTLSKFRSDHLGFAAVNEEGGELATVFYDRVESLGKGGDVSRLLGLAAAHELGHLLLGSKAHTDEGIMRPYWTRKLLRQVDASRVLFTLEQTRKIQERMSQTQTTAGAVP